MENKKHKPKQSAQQLVDKMRDEKGILFHNISEADAVYYLENTNNYLRTAAYRKNYQKHTKGKNKGKYMHLDFAYLQELSTIDMHFRFMVSKMCLDIEHDLKVQLIKDIACDPDTDGYEIVEEFLSKNPVIIAKLEAYITSPFTGDLIRKYFTIQTSCNTVTKKNEYKIKSYCDCPAWVLLELLTFGDTIRFYEFYYDSRKVLKLSTSIIHLVKNLRNGAAHNNCILANLAHSTAWAPHEISSEIKKIKSISNDQRQKRLSCRPMLEFVCLLYVYKSIVSDRVKYHRIQELKELFFVRMLKRKEYFKDNDLIKSNYQFACKVIAAFFPEEKVDNLQKSG